MRNFSSPTLLLVALCACSSANPAQFTEPPLEGDATTAVNPDYCNNFCQAAESAGTLTSTFEACLSQCWTMTPNGCGEMDGGTQPADGDDEGWVVYPDAGDGPVCAHPCGTLCCAGTETCQNNGSGQFSCGTAQSACTSNSECPSSAPCCEVQKDGTSACAPRNSTGTQACRCSTRMDCG